MSVSLRDIAPTFAQAFDHLAQEPLFKTLNESLWIFSLIETFHLLCMALLGGAVLALNLRLLGVALPKVPPADVERATRPWLWGGTFGTIGTGTLMALATSVTTLASAAFLVKVIALIAAILFSLAVSAQVRKAGEDQQQARVPLVLAGTAVALWAVALGLFASTSNLGAGALLVAISGFALFAALTPQRRFTYLAGVVPILGVGIVGSLFLPASEEGDALARGLSSGAVALALVFAIGVVLRERRNGADQGPSSARLAAFASTLAWVTTAAAGRWIGFS